MHIYINVCVCVSMCLCMLSSISGRIPWCTVHKNCNKKQQIAVSSNIWKFRVRYQNLTPILFWDKLYQAGNLFVVSLVMPKLIL